MRKIIFATTLIALMLHVLPVSGKMRCTPVYIFGVSASFNDSIVYFTEIQVLDSAWIDEKSDFLVKRSEYSMQLRDHFKSLSNSSRTCLVAFATSEKDILKKYAKMRSQFGDNKKKHSRSYDIRTVDTDEFRFQSLAPDDLTEAVTETSKKAVKRAKKTKEKISQGVIKEGKKRSSSDEESDVPPSMPPRH